MSDISINDSILRIIVQSIQPDIFSPYKILSDAEAMGTGFFINDKGHAITCAHVVEGSIKIWINIPSLGHTKYFAYIKSICFQKDIALLQVTSVTSDDYVYDNSKTNYVKMPPFKNKLFCQLADKNKPPSRILGVEVITMGYPLAQPGIKLTKGVISGVQERYIQIDAPINPGNSGGPLFLNNVVIGINTAKIIFAENIGYATPIEDYYAVESEMIDESRIEKIVEEPNLYFDIQHTNKKHYKMFGYDGSAGVLVNNLIKNSPISKTGLSENDILISFAGYELDGAGEASVPWSASRIHLYNIVSRLKLNQDIKVVYWSSRNKKIISASYLFNNDDTENIYKINFVRYPFEEFKYIIYSGLVIMELKMNHFEMMTQSNIKQEQKYYLLRYRQKKKRCNGIIFISNVLQGSSLIDEVIPGLVIKKVNGLCVETLDDVKLNISKLPNMTHLLLQNMNHIIIDKKFARQEDIELSKKYKFTLPENLY